MTARVMGAASSMAADVLVLDLDGSRGKRLAEDLSALGLRVVVCDSKEAASAKAGEAATLLIRRRLGSSDAFAFARALRKASSAPPRILILADAHSSDDILRAIDVSALGIVFEPHSSPELARRIRKAMLADPLDLIEDKEAPRFRVRRDGVVFKMKARPALLVDYLLEATAALGSAASPLPSPKKEPRNVSPPAAPADTQVSVEHRTGAFMVVRDDRQVLFANPAARALLALPDDLRRARFEEPLEVQRVIEKKIKSGRRSLDVIIQTRQIKYEGESALGVSLRDVTEMRNLESQLRLSNEILDRVPAIVLVADPDGRVAYAGPGVHTLLGYDAKAALGEGFWTLAWAHAEDAVRMRAEFTGASRRDEKAQSPFEALLVARDGSPRILAFQFAKGPGGTLLAVGQDVTARRQAESESTRARETAEAATAAKSDFLANMSHEIRTPMNAVIGMTSLLLETELSMEQRDYAEIIRKSGEALISLISDILDFSKIEAGKFEVDRHSCSAEALVEQCLDLLAARAGEKGLDLAGFVDATAAIEFWGDGTRIRQILVNLVANAVKFTESGGVLVEVRLQPRVTTGSTLPTRDELIVTVTDTGIGIPVEKLNRLFQPFSQLDASTTRKYGGTGLGLAISSQLAELMGGRLSVDSTAGKGSRFSFHLPVEVIGKTKHLYLSPASNWLAGKSILLCATGLMTTDVIARLISRWGGSVVRAAVTDASDWISGGETFDLSIIDHSRALDEGAAAISDAALRALKERCIERKVPVISLRPIASRNVVATQGISMATTMTPIKAASLYQSVERAIFGGAARKALESRRVASPVAPSPLAVLVAEDNLVNQKVARLTLQSLGFQRVDVAVDGLEVLKAMALHPYDIIFLDLHMPQMDGLETTKAIRREARKPRPWIVALTASAMVGDREMCLRAGMDDYLAKPLQREALSLVLDRAKEGIAKPGMPSEPKSSGPPGQRQAGGPGAGSPGKTSGSGTSFDRTAIERLRGLALPAGTSGSDVVTELVDVFLREVPDKLSRISKALSEEDFLKAHRLAQSLVSAAGNLGAIGVVGAARTLESALRLKSRTESEQAYLALKHEFEIVGPDLARERRT